MKGGRVRIKGYGASAIPPLFFTIPRDIYNHLCYLEVNMTNMDKHNLFPIYCNQFM